MYIKKCWKIKKTVIKNMQKHTCFSKLLTRKLPFLWYPLQQGGGSKYLVLRTSFLWFLGSKCELRTPSLWFRVLSSHLEPRAIFECFSNFFRNEVLSSCPRLYITNPNNALSQWQSFNITIDLHQVWFQKKLDVFKWSLFWQDPILYKYHPKKNSITKNSRPC